MLDAEMEALGEWGWVVVAAIWFLLPLLVRLLRQGMRSKAAKSPSPGNLETPPAAEDDSQTASPIEPR